MFFGFSRQVGDNSHICVKLFYTEHTLKGINVISDLQKYVNNYFLAVQIHGNVEIQTELFLDKNEYVEHRRMLRRKTLTISGQIKINGFLDLNSCRFIFTHHSCI